MPSVKVLTFYKFLPLDILDNIKNLLLKEMHRSHIKGTIILASEGINGTFAGIEEDVQFFSKYIQGLISFKDLQFQSTHVNKNPFYKAKVKIRKEIVSLGVENIDPLESTGQYLSPYEWNELMKNPEVSIIDTRNTYEIELGTFKNAINPLTENFREFPHFAHQSLPDKNARIAMFCTGGIRCEKASSYLRKQGYKNVYQLKGGILNYLVSIPKNESLWEGNCFVFDDRVALNHQLEGLENGTIDKEWKNDFKKKKINL